MILHFRTTSGSVQAVDGVDFDLDYNQAVVILGESGCGKSSLAKAILRLLPRNVATYSGKIYLDERGCDDVWTRRNSARMCAGSRCRWCRRRR